MINYKIFEKFDEKIFDGLNLNDKDYIYNIFQLENWIKITSQSSKDSLNLRIVIIYNFKEIICIAPLCIKIINGCRQLCWLSSDIIDYNNPIFLKEYINKKNDFNNIWNNIIKEISKDCDLIYFDKIPEHIKAEKNPLLNSNYKYYQFSYQLNLNFSSFDEFYKAKNNNKSIQTDRRKKRKLYEGNELEFIYKDCDKGSFREFEKLLLEKIKFYEDQSLRTFNKEIISKYNELIINDNKNYKFKICHCIKKKEKISSIFGVIHEKIFYYLIPIVYKHELSRYSPGRFHIIDLINWSVVNNLKFIDFTGGDEHYKSKWSNQKFKMFYYLKVINFRGIIRFISLTLYHLLRKNKILKKIYNLMKIKIS